MTKIKEIAKKYNLKVIEDSADTLGARIMESQLVFILIFQLQVFMVLILYCAGNGGVFHKWSEIYKKAKLLRSWGRSSSLFDEKSEPIENRFNVSLDGFEYDAKFVFEEIGHNLEGSEIGAAFGLLTKN